MFRCQRGKARFGQIRWYKQEVLSKQLSFEVLKLLNKAYQTVFNHLLPLPFPLKNLKILVEALQNFKEVLDESKVMTVDTVEYFAGETIKDIFETDIPLGFNEIMALIKNSALSDQVPENELKKRLEGKLMEIDKAKKLLELKLNDQNK